MSLPASLVRRCSVLCLLGAGLAAQAPDLRVLPTAKASQTLSTLLLANPLQTFVTYVDAGGAGSTLAGERLWLSASSALTLFDAGVLDGLGVRSLGITVPGSSALIGSPLYFQSFVLDAAAPNGKFRASNGQSAILHAKANAITFTFRDLVAEGVTGDFDASVRDRILAAPVRKRTITIEPAAGASFGQPVAFPLLTKSTRMQHVLRAGDLAAQGRPEYVTAIRWKPFGPVVADTYPRVHLTLGHSTVVPDYSLDPVSALPRYPLSGLGATFAANFKPADPTQVVTDGPYAIAPANLRPDGYLDWPAFQQPFLYDGFASLLLDFRIIAGPTTLGVNGFRTRLMVTSDSHPDTRAFAPANGGGTIDPFTVTTAAQGDNTYYETQVEFASAVSQATTGYVVNPGPQRIPYEAYLAGDRPDGTSVLVEYEGAISPTGAGATGFWTSPAMIAGYPFLRVRLVLEGNVLTGARPSVDTLVIPVD